MIKSLAVAEELAKNLSQLAKFVKKSHVVNILSSECGAMKCKQIGIVTKAPTAASGCHSFCTIHLHHLCIALNHCHESGDALSSGQDLKGFEDVCIICIDLLPRLIPKHCNFLRIIHLGGNDTLAHP